MEENSAADISAWLDFFDEQGYPQENILFMLGQVAAATYNVTLPKGRKALDPHLFYPEHLRPKQKPQTWQQQLNIFKGMAH